VSQSPDPADPVKRELYDQLVTAAEQRRTLTYFEAARAAGLSLDTPVARASFARMLRDISTREHRAGRPLLSALVVLLGNRRPGQGFFELARELDLLGNQPPEAFHRQELARVHDYWSARER
jgi:hypothetical protein